MFLCSINNFQGCARQNELDYRLTIEQKQGERLRDVTLYVPFSRNDSELLEPLLSDVRNNAQRLLSAPSNSDIGSVSTPYGKMLKIHFSKMRDDSVVADFEGSYDYLSVIGRPDRKYALKPVIDRHGKRKTQIYADYRGGTGFYFYSTYTAAYNMLPIIHPTGGGSPGEGSLWIVGKSATPRSGDPTNYLDDRIEITKKGWNEVPVW